MCFGARCGLTTAITEGALMRVTTRLWLQRFGWLLVIWLLSVAGLGVAAWALRLLMQSVGMSPP